MRSNTIKSHEIYAGLITTVPFILRLDGRAFHSFTTDQNQKFAKPYDRRFTDAMVNTARALVAESGLSPTLAYVFSDEISLYINTPVFDNRVEKLTSVASGFASSAFTICIGSSKPLAFDCRVIPISSDKISTYFAWRQAEAWRNHINGYAQKLLIDTGLSASKVQQKLNGMSSEKLHELAFSYGLNLAETPAWQRRGTAVYHTTVERDGYNPITKENVRTLRRKVIVDEDLPIFRSPEGEKWIFERILNV